MSRWLWALLAGVVILAIAAVFWIDQTSVLPPVLPRPTAVAPPPAPTAPESRALGSVLTFVPGRAGGCSPIRSDSGARSRSDCAARS
jgi:hypothetical protein